MITNLPLRNITKINTFGVLTVKIRRLNRCVTWDYVFVWKPTWPLPITHYLRPTTYFDANVKAKVAYFFFVYVWFVLNTIESAALAYILIPLGRIPLGRIPLRYSVALDTSEGPCLSPSITVNITLLFIYGSFMVHLRKHPFKYSISKLS